MERVSIFIDGCNFYYGLKSIDERYTDFKINFNFLCKKLASGRKISKVYYYNAPLKIELNPGVYKNQQRMFDRLKKDPIFEVVLCKRKKRTNPRGEEHYQVKEDDIHLAVDMLKQAYENKFDTAILVSGDGDFRPAVRYVKALGKKVENAHFVDSISFDLLQECNSSRPITKKLVKKCFLKTDTQSKKESE